MIESPVRREVGAFSGRLIPTAGGPGFATHQEMLAPAGRMNNSARSHESLARNLLLAPAFIQHLNAETLTRWKRGFWRPSSTRRAPASATSMATERTT